LAGTNSSSPSLLLTGVLLRQRMQQLSLQKFNDICLQLKF
jgi:hypothetical protein